MKPRPEPILPGQESVWSFPRPAEAQATRARVMIEHGGLTVADTRRSIRTIETSLPPSYYIPPEDIRPGALRRAPGRSFCEWKGVAAYWDIVLGDLVLPRAGWSYPEPSRPFEALRDHVAFYAHPFDRCTIDGEVVRPQESGFYGGWITNSLAGPFKGAPGTSDW